MRRSSFFTSAAIFATLLAAACSDAGTGNTDTASPATAPTEMTTGPQAGAETAAVRPELLEHYSTRPITDDVMYFVMPDRFANGDPANDRGGIDGGPAAHGFDPTHKGFYHGGDLKGLTAKLDYLADMGISAIWMTPIFKNKPVQGNPGGQTAAYHGYWITDFTQIDPHLGTNQDLKGLVAAAHDRNMKVIFDIITNHTADVIKYEECFPRGSDAAHVPLCDYRARADYPYTTIGGPDGAAINEGFAGDDTAHQTAENFARLTRMDFAYTPYVPDAEKDVKVPAWLNDMRYYHNRGDSEWKGESSLYGDFAGLDDLFTEHPRVKEGFTDIYKAWISDFRIDGFRIDTVRHVNDSFWQVFAPAIRQHAADVGIPNFYIFGEVYDGDPKTLSHFTRVAMLPAVLDFGFQYGAYQMFAQNRPARAMADILAQDSLYETDWSTAAALPTFLGNHDMGRIGHFIVRENAAISEAAALRRSMVAHALMYFARGVPVVYYGDEQGFIGDGHDQDAREDMFESKVASYADNNLLGTEKSSAADNFDARHPLYRELAALAALKRAHPALRRGSFTLVHAGAADGLLAFLREDADSGERLMVIVNGGDTDAPAALGALATSACFVAGTEGEVSRDSYTAPAMSWAIWRMEACGQGASPAAGDAERTE
jgi:glycosidase